MDTARNKKIKELRKKGFSYQKIGNKFNLTRERIRQIINNLTLKK